MPVMWSMSLAGVGKMEKGSDSFMSFSANGQQYGLKLTLRTRRCPLSAIYKLPHESKAIPLGLNNEAAGRQPDFFEKVTGAGFNPRSYPHAHK